MYSFLRLQCPCVYLSSDAVTERPCVMTVYILRPVVYVLLRTSQPSCQLPGLYFITSSQGSSSPGKVCPDCLLDLAYRRRNRHGEPTSDSPA